MINKRECIQLAFNISFNVEYFDKFKDDCDLIVLGIAGIKDNSGFDALMQAAFKGKHEVVKFLLKSGVNATNTDNYNNDALTYAKEQGFYKTADLIKKSIS